VLHGCSGRECLLDEGDRRWLSKQGFRWKYRCLFGYIVFYRRRGWCLLDHEGFFGVEATPQECFEGLRGVVDLLGALEAVGGEGAVLLQEKEGGLLGQGAKAPEDGSVAYREVVSQDVGLLRGEVLDDVAIRLEDHDVVARPLDGKAEASQLGAGCSDNNDDWQRRRCYAPARIGHESGLII
jgi:hypothetical protein